jgi:hypothetical protein
MPLLSEDDAKTIKRFEAAAKDHGVVMDLLDAIAEWQSSGQPAPMDMHFFELAAMAAPFAKIARLEDGTDSEEWLCLRRPTIPSRGTAHKLRLWVPFAASPLRRLLTLNVRAQSVCALGLRRYSAVSSVIGFCSVRLSWSAQRAKAVGIYRRSRLAAAQGVLSVRQRVLRRHRFARFVPMPTPCACG